MRRYRYRTSVLTGPWRETEAEAAMDAVRAKQAVKDSSEAAGLRWIVPGHIEERISGESTARAQ